MEGTIMLSDEARKEKNRYAREWRKKNPDKVKATQERYWERKAQAAPYDKRGRAND